MEKSKKHNLLENLIKIKNLFPNDEDLVMLIDKTQYFSNLDDKYAIELNNILEDEDDEYAIELNNILEDLLELSPQMKQDICVIDLIKKIYLLIDNKLNMFFKSETNIIKQKKAKRFKKIELFSFKIEYCFTVYAAQIYRILLMINLKLFILDNRRLIVINGKKINRGKGIIRICEYCKESIIILFSNISEEEESVRLKEFKKSINYEDEIKKWDNRIKNDEDDIKNAEDEIKNAEDRIKNAEDEIDRLTKEINKNTQKIDNVRKDINKIQPYLLLWVGEIEGYCDLIPFENKDTKEIQSLLALIKENLGLSSEDSIGEDKIGNGNSLKKS